MTGKPTSPGIWTRDGKFYRVWQSNFGLAYQHIRDDGLIGEGGSELPPANWRKLTAEPVACEAAKAEFLAWLDKYYAGRLIAPSRQLISDKAAELFAGTQHSDELAGLRQVVELQKVEIEQLKEQLYEAKWEASNFENGCEHLAEDVRRLTKELELKQQPEVIEGRGQVVTEERCGWYWREDRSGKNVTVVSLSYDEAKFVDGCRYIPVDPPTFPPREKFTAPPKPELAYVRVAASIEAWKPKAFWGRKQNGNWYDIDLLDGSYCPVDKAEILDPETGNVIKE